MTTPITASFASNNSMSTKTKPNGKFTKQPTTAQLTDVIEGLRNRISELERPTNICGVQVAEHVPDIVSAAQRINRHNDWISEKKRIIQDLERTLERERRSLADARIAKEQTLRQLDKFAGEPCQSDE